MGGSKIVCSLIGKRSHPDSSWTLHCITVHASDNYYFAQHCEHGRCHRVTRAARRHLLRRCKEQVSTNCCIDWIHASWRGTLSKITPQTLSNCGRSAGVCATPRHRGKSQGMRPIPEDYIYTGTWIAQYVLAVGSMEWSRKCIWGRCQSRINNNKTIFVRLAPIRLDKILSSEPLSKQFWL